MRELDVQETVLVAGGNDSIYPADLVRQGGTITVSYESSAGAVLTAKVGPAGRDYLHHLAPFRS